MSLFLLPKCIMPNNNIKRTIIAMATQRAPDKTVCPSEIARALFPGDWRMHMDEVRASAIDLQREGKVAITQNGQPVDVEHIKGPVRIKLVN